MTSESIIDVPRLRKELEYITANRAQWLQGAWLRRTACGTVGCLAGNTALNAGYLPVIAPGLDGTAFVSLERLVINGKPDFDFGEALATGRVRAVRDVARASCSGSVRNRPRRCLTAATGVSTSCGGSRVSSPTARSRFRSM